MPKLLTDTESDPSGCMAGSSVIGGGKRPLPSAPFFLDVVVDPRCRWKASPFQRQCCGIMPSATSPEILME